MQNFLEPFLINEAGFNIFSAPMNFNGSTESSIIKYLQKIIFKRDVLVDFKKILNLACSPEPFSVKNNIFKKIIKGLNTVLQSDEDIKTKADIFRYVFQSFVSSCKEHEDLYVAQFFLVLSHILGMNTLIGNGNKGSSDCDCIINVESFKKELKVHPFCPSSESFFIFKELLLCISKTSVNLNASELQSYYNWLQKLIKHIANSKPFYNIFFEIFTISAEVDFKLLEENLDDIFCNILSQEQSIYSNFNILYPEFLERIFKISAQFQRTVKFVNKFLSCIKISQTSFPKEIILPLNFINEFSTTVSFASNQQSLSLLDLLVENMGDCVNFISEKETDFGSSLLVITSDLLINFLKNVKLYAPSIAFTTLQAIIEKISNLKQVLQKFGNFLFNNKSFFLKNKDVAKTFLELLFYCGEIQMLINCYKDCILDPSHMKKCATDCDWQCCIDTEQWKKLVNFVVKSKLLNCDSQCFQLAMQKLRFCQLENTPLVEDSTQKLILYQLSSNLVNFNIFELLLPEDLTILMNTLTIKQSETVTRNIFNQLQKNENKTESETWLLNSAIQENVVFITTLFCEILKSTGSLVKDMFKDKHSSKIAWLLDEYFNGDKSVSEELLDGLPEKINVLLRNGKKLRRFITDHESLTRILEIFKFLPLFCMEEAFRRLGLSFGVTMATLLAEDENAVRVAFESLSNFLSSSLDVSACVDIGLFIRCLSEFSYLDKRTDFVKIKIIESLVRNSVNMKFGLNQIREMIDSPESFKLENPIKVLVTQVLLYNELGKCWQRAKKRKSDNDLIGTCRTKLAKRISEESKELSNLEINEENCEILLKILAIEINKAIKIKDENEIKNLMELKFPVYFDFAGKKLKKGFDEPSIMFLTVVVQSMPLLRKFLAESLVFKIWKKLKTQEKVNWRLFCVNTTEEEFNEILADLLKVSKKFLYSNSDKYSYNFFEIWVSFFEFTLDSKKNSCQLQLQEFFNFIHDCDSFLRDLPVRKKIFLMKFFLFCLSNKEVTVTSDVVDTIIRVVLEFFDDSSSVDDFRNLFMVEVGVASAILFKQFAWSKSKIHLIFLMFKHLLGSLMLRCNATKEIDNDDVFKLSICALSLEKWSSMMVKKEKDFARISAYFITALISSIASVTVLPAIKVIKYLSSEKWAWFKSFNLFYLVKITELFRCNYFNHTQIRLFLRNNSKIHLTNCISHFLSVSDSHTVSYLMRILKPGYQQVFNAFYTQFKKYHKYSGKI